MTPHEVIKDSVEKLPDLTCINGAMYFGAVETPCSGRETGECGSRCQNEQTYDEAMIELVEYMTNSQLSILLSVKEMVGKMKKDSTIINRWEGRQFSGCKTCGEQENCECESYNEALSDLQSLLDIEINKVKEL